MKLFKSKETKEARVADLQRDIARWESTHTRLCEHQTAARETEAALQREREQHVLPALEGDSAAQGELERLQAASDSCAVRLKDLATGITQAEARLAPLREQLATAQREANIERARSLAARRVQLAPKVQASLDRFLADITEADQAAVAFNECLITLGLRQPGINTAESSHRECVLRYVESQFAQRFGVGDPSMGIWQGSDLCQIEQQNLDRWSLHFDLIAGKAETPEVNVSGEGALAAAGD